MISDHTNVTFCFSTVNNSVHHKAPRVLACNKRTKNKRNYLKMGNS